MGPINIPNVLTLLRILAVPVIVVALLGETPNGDALAAGVFALAAMTDGLDGYIARRRQDVTTFGKLMDPLADKLLIVAALVSLVSLNRLAAWVAMVIIARELAVTGLRDVAVEQGGVISASWLGKVKTTLQVASVSALIIWNPSPWPVDVLVYLALAATVISGLDYFFGLRKRLPAGTAGRGAEETGAGGRRGGAGGRARQLAPGGGLVPAGGLEPLALRHVMSRVLATLELGEDLAEEPGSLRDHVVAVDRLQVLLAGEDEAAVAERRIGLGDAAHHLADAVLDESGIAMGLLDHGDLVGALHQLVDLRAHGLLDDVEKVARVDLELDVLGQADVKRSDPALVVGRDWNGREHALDLVVREPLGRQPLTRMSGDELLRARAGGHPLGLDAGERSGAAFRHHGGAEEGVDLLGR